MYSKNFTDVYCVTLHAVCHQQARISHTRSKTIINKMTYKLTVLPQPVPAIETYFIEFYQHKNEINILTTYII